MRTWRRPNPRQSSHDPGLYPLECKKAMEAIFYPIRGSVISTIDSAGLTMLDDLDIVPAALRRS